MNASINSLTYFLNFELRQNFGRGFSSKHFTLNALNCAWNKVGDQCCVV